MNRRTFLRVLGSAAIAGVSALNLSGIPEIIMSGPGEDWRQPRDPFAEINAITLREIYGPLIEDNFFHASPMLAYLSSRESGLVYDAEVA